MDAKNVLTDTWKNERLVVLDEPLYIINGAEYIASTSGRAFLSKQKIESLHYFTK
jgi:hypothetical protein